MSSVESNSEIPCIVTTDASSPVNMPQELEDVHIRSSTPPSDHSPWLSPVKPDDQHLPPSSYLSPSPLSRGSGSTRSSLESSLTLSPTLGPPSPSPSIVGSVEGSSHVPPSPTLSNFSARYASALALRDNKPEQRDGISSLGLLSPHYLAKHGRKGSVGSATSADGSNDGTEPDESIGHFGMASLSPSRANSDGTSLPLPVSTHTHFDTSSTSDYDGTTMRSRPASTHSRAKLIDRSHSPSGERTPPHADTANVEPTTDGNAPLQPRPALDLSADDAIDAGPFKFKPYRLAGLVDPKSLDTLEQMGGIRGLLRGLGTRRKKGLSARALSEAHDLHNGDANRARDWRPGAGDELGAGEGASQRHDRQQDPGGHEADEAVPGIIVTGEDGRSLKGSMLGARDLEDDDEDGPAFEADLEQRQRVYGANVLPTRKTKTLLQLMWLALKDKVLVLLSIAAVVSLALGFFQDFGTPRPAGEPPVDWVEGVAIIVAILIVVLVGSVNDWQKERQFQQLNEKKEERGVKVIRAGVECIIDVHKVVVGDVALLEPGEIIPCDGVYLGGHNVRCDESGATGESDAIRKIDYDEAIRNQRNGEIHDHMDCFVVSGSKVLEGYGSYVVIAVGPRSFNGRIMMALRGDTENTPLQLKLNILAELIAKVGSAVGLLLFAALMIRFFVQLGTGNPERTANAKGIAFVQILIISVTLIVVAVPEGLPLAVTLALAFATKRMTKENLLVRVLGSCETMANASVICTDKTGTLTQNSMTIVAGAVGIHCKFVRHLKENEARSNANAEDLETGQSGTNSSQPTSQLKHTQDFAIDQTELDGILTPQLRALFNDAVTVNSTAFDNTNPETGKSEFVGSKTETALLKFARENGWPDYKRTREEAEIVQMIPFSSSRKAMGIVMRLKDGRWRFHLKGASEILTKRCTRYVVVTRDPQQPGTSGMYAHDNIPTKKIDELANDNITRTTIFYANQMLRAIALCYRDFDTWPPPQAHFNSEDEVEYEDLAHDMTLLAITGIEDPLREGVRDAVAACHKAGVQVKMCTGDNVLTARSIAAQCGIYTRDGLIMEGPAFRALDDRELLEVVPRLQVLARSSPDDKKLLVAKLRECGEIVGVTGDGTNDGPALKTAHVGFSMGIAGTEVAKEASDIILMDDNFASIVKAIMWGRCVNDAVRKFLQFQISTNVTAVVVTFVTAVASASETSVLSAVQLLWINIIMDTFAALALATDPASPALLDRKPDKKTAPLFTVDMYKQIIGQSTYQVIIVLIFHFLGSKILRFDPSVSSDVVQTVVFNIFVFAQIANSVNCRRLDNRLNIFEGITRNYYFMAITFIEIAVQVLIVFVGGAAFQVTRIGGPEWGIGLALGVVSIPLGALIRCIPNWPVEWLLVKLRVLPNPQAEILPTTQPPREEWNPAIDRVRDNLDNLQTFAQVRGGRMRASSYVDRSRKARPLSEPAVTLPSLMAMVPTLVASSVGAGWAPHNPQGLADPANYDPSKSSAALWEGRTQTHPPTNPVDPAQQAWGSSSRSSHSHSTSA